MRRAVHFRGCPSRIAPHSCHEGRGGVFLQVKQAIPHMTRPPTALLASVPRPQSNRIRARAVAQQGFAALAALTLGACATMFAPGPDTILIQTDPPGAEVLLDGLTVGQTPTNIAVSRRARGNLSLRHPNHPPVDTHLTTTLNGPALINVLFPGLLGILIDAAGGNCTRWVSPELIRLPTARQAPTPAAPSVLAKPEKVATTAPQSSASAPPAIAQTTPDKQPPQEAPFAETTERQQPTTSTSHSFAWFYISASGFGLWPAAASLPEDGSIEPIHTPGNSLPAVRKAKGKTPSLALAAAAPAATTRVYFVDRNGSLAEGSVVAFDSQSGTLRILTDQELPLPGAPIVDRNGNVVGSALASSNTDQQGPREFAAVSCEAIQKSLRACPTITRPLPAPSTQERTQSQIEQMLRAATRVQEAKK